MTAVPVSRLRAAAEGPGGPPPPEAAGHAPPPGARAMNAIRWGIFAALALLAVVVVIGYVGGRFSKPRTIATATSGAVYLCPMHPNITSDRPGECPICGMSLEKREVAAAGGPAPGGVPGLTTIHLGPERVQMIGVRTVIAESRSLGGERELVGFVTPDESRLARVQLRVAGWVKQVEGARVGDRVERGTALLTLYSPELDQSEREHLIALAARDSGLHEHEAGLVAASRQRLARLGVPDDEIARLERTREATSTLALRAPVTGTVLERNVSDGQYVGPDTPLLVLADLSRVWVLADLYEQDLAFVHAGDRVRFASEALPGRAFEGRVEFVYPTVSTETRTVKARVALDNPGGVLKPGMFGRVLVRGAGGARTIVLPGEAVVNAGDERYVFLARAGGHFEPRRVVVGREPGDWVEVLSGVAAGDTVVASGSFLIDSESRLEAAIAGMGKSGAPGHEGH